MKEFYESPLSSRYASEYMLRLCSPDKRYGTWRRLWVALARAEHRLGLPVTDEQVAQLEAHVDDEIDYAAVAEWEKKLRHDVMAHIHVYGESCPDAAGIIHLGATSCYVTDTAMLCCTSAASLFPSLPHSAILHTNTVQCRLWATRIFSPLSL